MRTNSHWLVLALCLSCAGAALAESHAEQPAMSPEMAAMMEAWQKAMTPGPQHAMLASSAGTWNVAMTMWMEPGAPPTEGTGVAVRTAILGDRTVREDFTSEFMGMPFEGMALTGYDNVTQRYWSTWTDNMSTGLMHMTGTASDDGSTMSFAGEHADPMGGGMISMRIETVNEGADREVHTFYEKKGDEEERVSMKMVYTRAK